jgi:magnesium chelatase subunit D
MSNLPFSAVVGQDDAKTALLLAAIEPRLGGVLLRGQKGSAKTTLARGLAGLLPGDAPFVELPLGATEDRVLGSLDLAELLTTGTPRYRPGLLAAAHGGVLYVDEINLLADHLVDVLLDVAVSGVNRVEREGVSHSHPARFVLVASMNPEEGELRPQLLDRFGLAVDIEASKDPVVREAAVRRQLEADADPATLAPYVERDCTLRDRLRATAAAPVPADVVATAARVAVAVGAEGLRADLMLCRAAAAHAGWETRPTTSGDDLRRVAPFVLAHRRRRTPFDDPGLSPDELDEAFAPPVGDGNDHRERDREETIEPDHATAPPPLPTSPPAFTTPGRRAPTSGTTGRFVRDAPATEASTSLAVTATAVSVAARRATDPGAAATAVDLREAVREHRVGNLVVLVVDASGSMGAQRRIAAAQGVALELLTDAYQHRDRVALVTFRGERAEIVLRPTGSIEIARARLGDVAVGGATPLADALDTALAVAKAGMRDQQLDPLLVVLTDGRATSGGDDPVAAAHAAAVRVAGAGVPAVVVDAEIGPARLGLAADLARSLKGEYVALDDFSAERLDPYMGGSRGRAF